MPNHERIIDDEGTCHSVQKLYARFVDGCSLEMVFDPDQDPEEKRAVRQGYRALTKKIEGRTAFIPSQTVPV
jgi:hypothetical protein